MSDEGKLAALLADERAVQRIVDAMHSIDQAVTALALKFKAFPDPAKTTEGLEKAEKGVKSIRAETEKLLSATDLQISSVEALGAKFAGVSQMMTQGATRFSEELSSGFRSTKRELDEMMLALPFGVGVALKAMTDVAYKKEQLKADARRTVMEGFGGSESLGGRNQIEGLGLQVYNIAENLRPANVSIREVSAAFQAFGRDGVKLNDVLGDSERRIDGFGKTVAEFSINFDKAFKLVAGSSASAMSQMLKSGGAGSLLDGEKALENMGKAALATGTNMQSLLQNILGVTGAMKLQGVSADGLTASYYAATKAATSMFQAQGMRESEAKVRAQAFGQAAVSNLATFGADLPIDKWGAVQWTVLSQILGENADQTQKRGISDEDVLYNLRRNPAAFIQRQQREGKIETFSDERQKDVNDRLANLPGLTAVALYQMYKSQGMEQGTIEAVMTALGMKITGLEEMLTSGKLPEQIAKELTDADRAALEKQQQEAAKTGPLTNNSFNEVMDRLQDALGNVGEMLNTTLGFILKAIIGVGMEIENIWKQDIDWGKMASETTGQLSQQYDRVKSNLTAARFAAGTALTGAFNTPDLIPPRLNPWIDTAPSRENDNIAGWGSNRDAVKQEPTTARQEDAAPKVIKRLQTPMGACDIELRWCGPSHVPNGATPETGPFSGTY